VAIKEVSKAVRDKATQSPESESGCKLTELLKKDSFNPKSQNFDLPNTPEYNPKIQITLEAWFKTDNLYMRQPIITKFNKDAKGIHKGEPYYQYHLELRPTGQLYFALAIDGKRRVIDGAFLVNPDKWYHVAATYDKKCMKLYLCGKIWENQPCYPGTIKEYHTPLQIGGVRGPIGTFKGQLAEVRIWNVARTANQISAYMQKRIWPTEKGLVWSSTNYLKNLALKAGAKASESSTRHTGADRAIDGNTDGKFNNGSVTHTQPDEPNSWWRVDLPSPAIIERIVIWNRTDPCCRRRLSNLHISVLNDSEKEVWGTDFRGPIKDADFESFSFDPVRGRFVKVQIAGLNLENNGVLSLAEVQVFGEFTK